MAGVPPPSAERPPAAPGPGGSGPGEFGPGASAGQRLGDDGLTLIKSNVKRSVFRELGPTGSARMIKIFHAPGLDGLRDRGRAKAEERRLRDAALAGLPVAEVHGTIKVAGAWRLVASWIEGARPLDQVLEGLALGAGAGAGAGADTDADSDAGAVPRTAAAGVRNPRRSMIARSLGDLLARCQEVGFVHGDPHSGNVLVDRDGALWLVDLAGSRLWRPQPPVLIAFARGVGALRETAPRFLAAVYAGWRRATAMRGLGPLPKPREMDLLAKRHRLAASRRRLRVWRRTSTPTEVIGVGAGASLRVRAHEAPPGDWTIHRMTFDSQRSAEEAWDQLVRARIHHLPAARPMCLSLGPPWAVEYAVPEGTNTGQGPGQDPKTEPPGEALRELLRHRGLQVKGPLLLGPRGESLIGPLSTLVEEPLH